MVKSDEVLEHLPAVPLLVAAAPEAAVVEGSCHRSWPRLLQRFPRHRKLRDVLQADDGTRGGGVVIDVVYQAQMVRVPLYLECCYHHV